MASGDKAKGMKSAYELALERLEAQGIERPSDTTLTGEQKAAIAEARNLTESKLAELEILHRDASSKTADPVAREKAEEDYRRERRRLEEDCERQVGKLRRG
jgi:hypothetical protein